MSIDAQAQTELERDDEGVNDVEPSEDGVSTLADHRKKFSNQPRLNQAPEKPAPKHRAQSRQATADDVEEINTLTARLREAEKDAGLTIERKDGESERVFNLRRQAEIAEAIRDAKRGPKPDEKRQTITEPEVVEGFAEPPPKIEDFLKSHPDDAYSPWNRAMTRWEIKKEQFEAKQEETKTRNVEWEKTAVANREAAYKAHGERVQTFRTATKDYEAVINGAAEKPTPLLLETALVNDPDGPRYIYNLAKNEALFDEFFLLTDQKPITRDTVATVQRLLKSRMPVVSTGSTAAARRESPPRPLNPVRTAPQSRGEVKPPGEGATLAEHRSFYGTHRRRG